MFLQVELRHSRHWNTEIEDALKNACNCEHLLKMLTPRKNINSRGQVEVWAMKLMHKLKLLELE